MFLYLTKKTVGGGICTRGKVVHLYNKWQLVYKLSLGVLHKVYKLPLGVHTGGKVRLIVGHVDKILSGEAS